ncbi:MAG TPA: thiolase family protein [Gemmatimonadales bacterium]|jgi:3-oxoadipyl-CoA thiolase|nr:thiolase family protein [Gemmatimonadales bacterium]
MTEVYLTAAVRTPVGRAGGALAEVRPDDLAAVAIKALVERAGLPPERIEDVILGCANQAGEDNRNVARMALLLAGLPVSVPGQTVNRLCGSGLQAIVSAAQAVRAGEGEVFVAGGVESMTRAPYVMLKSGTPWSRTPPPIADSTVGWRFINPRLPREWTIALGETAERVARLYGITRREQDEFAAESQRRAQQALAQGVFAEEIVPVPVPGEHGRTVMVSQDEHPRPGVTVESLARLKPAFAPDGTVTAGSSSGINDGAAALSVVGEPALAELGQRPLARIVAAAVAGVDPSVMGLGPVPATRKALARAGLRASDLDLVELNEAFAAQSIACIRDLELDPAKVNIYGGAIALGHPLGASGARIVTTLVHALRRTGGRYGLATMCIGVGQGIAMIVEATEPRAG